MAQLEINEYGIEKAFRDCFYIVPDFQREYVWEEEQVTQLLEDIDGNFGSGSSEYFIGTVVVAPKKDKSSHFDIIDGQQRLTTIFLILCALRVLFKGKEQGELISDLIKTRRHTDPLGEVKFNRKLDIGYADGPDVVAKILETHDSPKAVRQSTEKSYGSSEKILQAYEAIHKFLIENYKEETKLKNYWGYFSQKVVFIQISNDISNALKIFETINERGVGLNPMDLLKNLLFMQVESEEFTKLKNKWKKITDPLEKETVKEKPLRFLRYFIMANYDVKTAKRSGATIRESEIYDWFSDNPALTNHENKPFEFVDSVAQSARWYGNFVKGLGTDDKGVSALASLKKLTGGAFRLHYILLLAAAKLPEHFFNQFVNQIESFLFYCIFTKTQAKYIENFFANWVKDIREIACIEYAEDKRQSLNRFIDEHFAKEMERKTPELKDALKRLSLDSMPQYQIRYLLARLAQHVDMKFQGLKTRDSLDSYLKHDIEHILPKNPDKNLRDKWDSELSNLPDSNLPDDEAVLPYDEAMQRLGNLTLLEPTINIVAGNDSYAEKLPKYKESRLYLTSSLVELSQVGQNSSITRINKQLSSFETWDAAAIEKRQSLLIDLALEVWKTKEITAN